MNPVLMQMNYMTNALMFDFCNVLPFLIKGGLMVQFYYQYKWKRLIMISTIGDAYEAGAAVIEESLKQHKQNNYTIAHHYSNVRRNATDDVIDAMLNNIKHEGRSE